MAEFAGGPPIGGVAKDVAVVPIGGMPALEKLAPFMSWIRVVGEIAFSESIDDADVSPSDRLLLNCVCNVSRLL
jgi:hypothetical protein